MARGCDKKLVMQNGSEFYGTSFGSKDDALFELVFNTGMVGYQETVTDLSYTDQGVVMTYPLVGNYGITDEDFESKYAMLKALIVREYNDTPSNFRYTKTLAELMEENGVAGLSGVDTRMITRMIRSEGSGKALITDADTPLEEALKRIEEYEMPHDSVKRASCKKKWYSRTANSEYDVVVIDCGLKLNIVRRLNAHHCNVTVLPYSASCEEVMALKPDGVLISNGPGDPKDLPEVVKLVKDLRGKIPMMGICMGYHMINLAYGATTFKMKFGHKGENQPVRDLDTGKIDITSQNHNYALDPDSVKPPLRITHVNLLDNTVEGVACDEDRVFAIQFHPEASPGPQDAEYLFDRFIENMKEGRK